MKYLPQGLIWQRMASKFLIFKVWIRLLRVLVWTAEPWFMFTAEFLLFSVICKIFLEIQLLFGVYFSFWVFITGWLKSHFLFFKLKQNQLEMEEMKKSWQQRLKEQEIESLVSNQLFSFSFIF